MGTKVPHSTLLKDLHAPHTMDDPLRSAHWALSDGADAVMGARDRGLSLRNPARPGAYVETVAVRQMTPESVKRALPLPWVRLHLSVSRSH